MGEFGNLSDGQKGVMRIKLMNMRVMLWAVVGTTAMFFTASALPAENGALPNERLLQQELKQQQIRTTTQRVADQLTTSSSTGSRLARSSSSSTTSSRLSRVRPLSPPCCAARRGCPSS